MLKLKYQEIWGNIGPVQCYSHFVYKIKDKFGVTLDNEMFFFQVQYASKKKI